MLQVTGWRGLWARRCKGLRGKCRAVGLCRRCAGLVCPHQQSCSAKSSAGTSPFLQVVGAEGIACWSVSQGNCRHRFCAHSSCRPFSGRRVLRRPAQTLTASWLGNVGTPSNDRQRRKPAFHQQHGSESTLHAISETLVQFKTRSCPQTPVWSAEPCLLPLELPSGFKLKGSQERKYNAGKKEMIKATSFSVSYDHFSELQF